MKIKSAVKKITDAAMLLLMPLLAAKIQLGHPAHEWIGALMAALFLLHHILNYKWFKTVFNGDYSPLRTFTTVLNLLLLVDVVSLIYSGIRMSGFVFSWIHLPGRNSTARILHLSAYYWGLIFMSVHTGVHSGLHSKPGKLMQNDASDSDSRGIISLLIKMISGALSLFGIYSFINQNISSYLFMQTHFMFYDENKGLFMFLLETVCIMILFMAAGHYITVFLKKWRIGETGKKTAKIIAFSIPVIVCIAVVFAFNSGGGEQHHSNGNDSWNKQQSGEGQNGRQPRQF